LGLDGKVDDDTLFHEEVEVGGVIKLKKSKRKEHHLTFTQEFGNRMGAYLTHRMVPLKGCDSDVLSSSVYKVLAEYDSIHSIKALLLDNTPLNTGRKGGLVVKLEGLLQRRIHTIGCSLHLNELPLRAVFKYLDGTTQGPTTFNGPLGRLCSQDIHNEIVIDFQPIPNPVAEICSLDECSDLSNDQKLLLHYCVGIGSGSISPTFEKYKIGPLNHARWLTLAIRLLCLYTRTSYPTAELVTITKFILLIYAPTWFRCKLSSQLKDCPQGLFKAFKELQCFDPPIQKKVQQVYQRSAFCLLPENVLYSLVRSNCISLRRKGWNIIKKLRTYSPKGNHKEIPRINFDAAAWTDMIDLNDLQSSTLEPPSTLHFSIDQLNQFCRSGEEPEIDIFPSHTQSVERCVRMVSSVSKYVCGQDRRHNTINVQILSDLVRPTFANKGSYCENFDNLLEFI